MIRDYKLKVGDKVAYPSGKRGAIVSVDAGVSIQTEHGRDWMCNLHAYRILTLVDVSR